LNFLSVYLPFLAWGVFGWTLGQILPSWVPRRLAQGLFWLGIPLVIFSFLRQADLTGPIWLAGAMALLGVSWGLLWTWLGLSWWGRKLTRPEKGAVLLTGTMGNTGYLGYPIVLALVGPAYLGWAVFYDVVGTLWSVVGGGALASSYGRGRVDWGLLGRDLALNPILWSFVLTLLTLSWSVAPQLMTGVNTLAHAVIPLALILLGMRLTEPPAAHRVRIALPALVIKTLVMPLGVWLVGRGWFSPQVLLVLVLQAAMPPAISTLILTEAYGLDRELTALTIVLGTLGTLLTLPLWLGLVGS